MTIDRIREARDAQPFRPFTLRMADQSVYQVSHPEFLFIPKIKRPRVVMFAAPKPDDAEEFTTHWLNLLLVVSLVVDAAGNPNGQDDTVSNGD